MDLDRTSLGERANDLRNQKAPLQSRGDQPADAPDTVTPDHGGALAAPQTDKQDPLRKDPDAEARRREAHEQITRFLRIPGNTDLDIQVDTEQEEVIFQIRDRDSGKLLKEVPEGDAAGLFDKLREHHGALIDRSF
ncbi:MAG: flagellar protein FlaG [Planctomycetes bacterium]|nr:flagellar protein FlaG [Planctomycetota bacterium]